jgi:hypothetical protein
MYCAFSGISSLRAFSTDLAEARAWTVVQTPQKRWVKVGASRGSRPWRITSMPRHIWPEDQAFTTLPLSTSQSIRKCPSIRVMGSMVILLAIRQSPYCRIGCADTSQADPAAAWGFVKKLT